MSDIAIWQNEPPFQRLLKARQWLWEEAGRWQRAQIFIVTAAPALALTLGAFSPNSKPYISFFAVLLTLADAIFIDREYKLALKTAARASELFDVELFRLPWSSLVAGKQPSPEEIDKAVRRWDAWSGSSGISDWYASDVGKLDIDVARVICQRINVTYDSDLRRLCQSWIDYTLFVVALLLIVAGMIFRASLTDFILSAWVPFAPLIIWGLRERFRQADAVKANAPLIQEAENIIDLVADGKCDHQASVARSRALQDAIFHRRATTVLLLPKIYKCRRPDAERDMLAGAGYWVDKVQKIRSK